MSVRSRDEPDLLAQTERWFLRRGLPHLIEDYRATEDVFTRMVWVLGFVGLLGAGSAVRSEWQWWQNALAMAGGAAVLVAAYATVNLARGRRPLQRPDTVGPVELALFVVLPTLPAFMVGEVSAAVGNAIGNVAFLAVVYLVTSYGLVPMTRWALGRTLSAFGTLAELLGRALPLMFGVTILVFVNTEAWQVAAALPGGLFFWTGSMFVVVGLVFLTVRLPGEVRRLDRELGDGGVAEACVGTPMEEAALSIGERCRDQSAGHRDLSRRQRLNVYLVFLFAQGVQAALVTLAVFGFFVLFGLVAIRPVVVEGWLGTDIPVEVVARFAFAGHDLVLTEALLKVSGFVAFVAGISFTLSLVTDAGYREELLDEIVDQVRQALAVRSVYLAVRSGSAG